jgi:hypothetical protein
VTPLGMAASEPAKVFLTRRRLATRESVASLAIDNLVYAASVATVVVLGVALVLVTVPLPPRWREAAIAALVGMAAAGAVGLRLLLGTWSEAKSGQRPPWRERLARIRRSILQFSAVHPGRLGVVFGLHMTFHTLAVLEVFLTLRWLVGDGSVTVSQAVVFEALNRVVTVAFKFVPFRIGVDEALSGALAGLLSVQPVTGVTLAVVRKIRNLFWTGIGLSLIAVPVREAPVTDRP